MTRDDIQVGDETTVVITDTNAESSRDPIAQIDGKICFVRYPDGTEPEFGESVRVKVADESDGNYVAVVME
jgi:predicted RNA-binding protein with TRAM domain